MAVPLKAVLTMNGGQFFRTIRQARAGMRDFAQNSTRDFTLFKAVVAGAFLYVGKKAIDAASEMEQLTASFEVLLGSASKAGARMKELESFSLTTPFQLDEVARASRVLETLTRGALSTKDGLTLVGDTASAVQVPFEELSVTIGRLYDGLRSGNKVGEELRRLQELGALTGGGRRKIEGLSAGGFTADAWKAARQELSRFSGQMNRQSSTWAGQMSNFQDSIQKALRSFGGPMIEGLKPTLTLLSATLIKGAPLFAQAGKLFADSLGKGAKGLSDVLSDSKSIEDFGDKLGKVVQDRLKKAIATAWDGFTAPTDAEINFWDKIFQKVGVNPPDVGSIPSLEDVTTTDVNTEGWDYWNKRMKNPHPFGNSLLSGMKSIATPGLFNGGSMDRFLGGRSRFTGGMLGGGPDLNDPARRTTSLLGFRERRAIDMARRAEIEAKGGDVGNMVRRGDRQRRQAVQREMLRSKEGLEKTNSILESVEKKFDEVQKSFAKFAN